MDVLLFTEAVSSAGTDTTTTTNTESYHTTHASSNDSHVPACYLPNSTGSTDASTTETTAKTRSVYIWVVMCMIYIDVSIMSASTYIIIVQPLFIYKRKVVFASEFKEQLIVSIAIRPYLFRSFLEKN